MNLHHRGEKASTLKALAIVAISTLAMAGLVYWQWPFFEFWLILLLINF